jgi:HAD superfamily hydrolase (TIGR01509 family)
MRPDRLPTAVLWDMDGTLVDTEPSWFAAETAIVEAAGGSWSQAQAKALLGSDLLVAAEKIRRQGPVDLEPTEIVERMLDRVAADVTREVPWRPGARELLAELVELGVPCALVTMSWARLAQAVVDALPPGTFAAVVTGDDVRHGKPHPEPYLEAARRLGVEPGECIALEDSPTGAASATAARVPTVVVPHVVPVPAGPGQVIVPTLDGVDARRLAELARSARPDGEPDLDETDAGETDAGETDAGETDTGEDLRAS